MAASTRRLSLLLGCGQLLSFASTLYLVAPLAGPMAAGMSMTRQTVLAAFSMALAIAALAGPGLGRAIDRHGGRAVLMSTSLLLAIGLFALGEARDAAGLYAGWAVIGVAMGAGLYEGAFATLVQVAGPGARAAITAVTLMGSVSSTVGWLLSAWLVARFGWRDTCLVWAGLQLALGLPLHAMLPRARSDTEARADAAVREPHSCPPPQPSWRVCAALSTSFAATSFTGAAMATHLPRLLGVSGAGATTIWVSAALVGPAQLVARALELRALRQASPLGLARTATALQSLGTLILAIGGAPMAGGFALLHGLGNGLSTIARATLPLTIFGAAGYGRRQGWLIAPARVSQAFAPWLFGLIVERLAAALAVLAALGILGLCALFVVPCAAQSAPPAARFQWPTSTPEAQGLSSEAMAGLVDYGAANSMDSLLVIRHGTLVAEATYAPFRPGMKHAVNSVTKAVVGTLAGIAHEEGTLGPLDLNLGDLFPGSAFRASDAAKRSVTLAQLLTMTSGLAWQEPLTEDVPRSLLEMRRSPNWVDYVLSRPMAALPGTTFNYDSGTWQLLVAALQKKTAMDPREFARQKLFDPLDITDVDWPRDPQGLPAGGFGLAMHPRDMAKIGWLYLRGGDWQGRQLVPRRWIDEVVHADVDMHLAADPGFRYANGWWVLPDRHAYLAVGFLRQLIVVLPDLDMVVVATGKRHYPLAEFVDRLRTAALRDAATSQTADGNRALALALRRASTEVESAVLPASAKAASISGRTYLLADNPFGLRVVRLTLDEDSSRFDVQLADPTAADGIATVSAPVGLHGVFGGASEPSAHPVVAKGTWLDRDTFELTTQSIAEGVVRTFRLTYRDAGVDLLLTDNSGTRAQLAGTAAR